MEEGCGRERLAAGAILCLQCWRIVMLSMAGRCAVLLFKAWVGDLGDDCMGNDESLPVLCAVQRHAQVRLRVVYNQSMRVSVPTVPVSRGLPDQQPFCSCHGNL
jgi:hypothetical protein